MAQQPPGGWEQFATKGDLAELETRTQEGFLDLKSAILELKSAVVDLESAVVETQSSVVALDAKMEVQFSELRGQIATQFAAVDTRFGAVDTRFGELSGQRARDVWAFAVAMTVTTISVCCSIFVAVWQLAPS